MRGEPWPAAGEGSSLSGEIAVSTGVADAERGVSRCGDFSSSSVPLLAADEADIVSGEGPADEGVGKVPGGGDQARSGENGSKVSPPSSRACSPHRSSGERSRDADESTVSLPPAGVTAVITISSAMH
jgi:hypothetical protein